MNNAFEKEEKYRLYRTVKEIFHPTISKKNISNYKIIVNDELLPLRIFYPEKVSNMQNVAIYIYGNINLTNCHEKYANILSYLALNTNNLVITIDSSKIEKLSKKKQLEKIYEMIKYIYLELKKININNISLFGDSTGATTILKLKQKFIEDNILINKQILFYPMIIEKYMTKKLKCEKDTFDNKLIIIGDKDENYNELKNYTSNYYLIPNMKHGFLKEHDEKLKKTYTNIINEYLQG